jgi:hypothetical protein
MLLKVTSQIPVDSFCVVQERGTNSTVEVFEEVYADYPRDKKALRFVSDQSLTSNSDRAWNVTKAIENYAKPKGFDTSRYTQSPNKNELIAFYDASFHSHMVEFQLREQIKSDERYQAQVIQAKQLETSLNQEYGSVIRQLKNLISKLEKRNQQELESINHKTIAVQLEILQDLDIPEFMDEQHKKRLFEPNYPIDQVQFDHYSDYGQGYDKLPDDLDSILALLD